MKRRLLITISFLVIVSCLYFSYGCGCLSGYRFRSEESIRMKLLKQTPLGSSREEVLKHVNSTYGSEEVSRWHESIKLKYSGLKHGFISRRIKNYFVIFPILYAEIYAVWIFNEEGKLVEIKVHRYEDAMGG